jgi:hypothetical protein
MELLKIFTNFLSRKEDSNDAPEGFCPQCWGRQEYEGKFYEAIYKEQINAENISSKAGWIDAYVKQNLEGIKLKEIDGIRECSTCNLTYRQS